MKLEDKYFRLYNLSKKKEILSRDGFGVIIVVFLIFMKRKLN